MEGLSLLISDAKDKGIVTGIDFSPTFLLTHLFFVDDVILFGKGSLEEWSCYRRITDIFTAASGMLVSLEKYVFL